MIVPVGTRVIAIQKADEKTVYVYGEGIYKGLVISPYGFPNPQIELDNGDIVWGYECWWGEIERVKKVFGGREIIVVNISQIRSDEE